MPYCSINTVNAAAARKFRVSCTVPVFPQELPAGMVPLPAGASPTSERIATLANGVLLFRVSATLDLAAFAYSNIPVDFGLSPAPVGPTSLELPDTWPRHERVALQGWPGARVADFWWHYRWSEPTIADLVLPLPSAEVRDGGALRFWPDFAERKGLATFGTHGNFLQILNAGTILGDGQGILVRGRVAEPSHPDDLALSAYAIADNWPKMLRLVGIPPWLDLPRLANWCRGEAFRARVSGKNDPFYFPKYLNSPGGHDTGDHFEFGAGMGLGVWAAMVSGEPAMLDVLLCDAAQEAARPMSFMERDGSPYKKANHPQCWFSGGRPYPDYSYSPDMLGKPAPWNSTLKSPGQHGFNEEDPEHWSINHLVGTYFLTGDPGLRWLLEDQAEAIKSNLAEGSSYNYLGNVRAVGRMLMTASQLFEALGDPDLLTWIRGWFKVLKRIWVGGTVSADPVKVHVVRADDFWIKGKSIWNAYEHNFLVTGLVAAHGVTGDPDMLAMAKLVAETLVRYAWREVQPGLWHTARLVEYVPNGEPPDPATTYWQALTADGTFDDNGIAPVIFAGRDWGIEPARCAAIIASVSARRRSSDGYGGPDRYCSWASV